ncbi:MAG: hypothetical protein P8Y64_06770 [Gammaproteobacteria bacterium]|jgi:hypothetical protein
MRDYNNMPRLPLSDEKLVTKAHLQIQRLEPLILEMPADMDISIDGSQFNCREIRANGLVAECDVIPALTLLAQRHEIPQLEEIGKLVDEYDMTIDIDPEEHRIIIHT